MARWKQGVSAVFVFTVCCAGGFVAEENGNSPPEDRSRLPDNFYFTGPMVEMFVEQMSENLSRQLQLDPEQQEVTRSSLQQRITHWLIDNRENMEPVLNEFMGMWAGRQSPTAERMAEWSRRALPVLNDAIGMFKETSEGWREYLSDEQNVLLDGNLAAMDVGTRFVTERLSDWQQGGYDPTVHWHRAPGFREAKREEDKRIREEQQYAAAIARGESPDLPEHLRIDALPGADAVVQPEAAAEPGNPGSEVDGSVSPPIAAQRPGTPPVQPPAGIGTATAPDEWQQYVDAFCARYNLTAEQRSKAQQFLDSARTQRDAWRAKSAERRSRLEALLRTAKTDEGRKAAQKNLEDLDRTFKNQFERLKEKLEKLPTREQKRTAAEGPQAKASGG